MNVFSSFPKAPALLEPHHQIVWCHFQDTRWGGGLTSQQRYSRRILQLMLTGQNYNWYARNNPKKLIKGLRDYEIRAQVDII